MSTQLAPASQKIDTLRALFERAKPAIADVIPKHLTPDRLTRVTLAAVSRTPLLLQCDPKSILQSVMVASQLGLEPTGVLGSAYLVPFRNKKGTYEAQLIIGYRGLIDLARRSGQIVSIDARVVREKDRFSCRFGLEPVLEHEPCWEGDPGPLKAVYAVAHIVGGSTQVEVMTKAEIEAVRRRSRAGNDGPWVSDYDEMSRKTVVRRLAKYLPLSVEFATALEIQAHAEAGEVTDYAAVADLPELDVGPDGEAATEGEEQPVTQTARVKDKLKAVTAKAASASATISESQAADLRSALQERGVKESEWCTARSLDRLEDLPVEEFGDALGGLF